MPKGAPSANGRSRKRRTPLSPIMTLQQLKYAIANKGGKGGNTICSGVISHKLNGRNIIARHLDVHDKMTVDYVT